MQPSLQTARTGIARFLQLARRLQVAVGALFVLTLLMLPFGRTAPNDGGGILAPLTVDSGYLFRTRPAADFFSVYDAGTRLLNLQDPYGVNAATGQEGLRVPYVATFRYLPITTVWLAAPLNILPPWPAFTVWVLLNLGMLVGNYLICLGRSPDRPLALAVVWFAWFPVIAEWHMGQFTLFMATLMLWSFDSLMAGPGRRWGSGWLLAVLLKVYPIGMAPSLWLWRRRGVVVAALVLAVGVTVLWRVAVPSAMDEGLVNRGVGGRIIGELRVPYAGAMGVQAMVNAMGWKAAGLSLDPNLQQTVPVWASRGVPVVSALLLGLYGLGALYILWRTRGAPSWAAIGYYWLVWFFAYVDCWDHHYVLIQALLGVLLAWGIIGSRTALICWLSAGAPSLWWLWYRMGYAGSTLPELIGTAYFLQRPVAVFLLAGVLLLKAGSEGVPPSAKGARA